MENRHESVVAEVVAFVVVLDPQEEFEGSEYLFDEADTSCHAFSNPEEAFAFAEGKPSVFCKKLQLPGGEFVLTPGFGKDSRVGQKMRGVPCSRCGHRTWWDNSLFNYGALCYGCNYEDDYEGEEYNPYDWMD